MRLMSENARRQRIKETHDSLRPDSERIRLPWQGGEQVLPVLTLPLECVVLNPKSHRIRSQVESHPEKATIENDPFSEAAQVLIAEILRKEVGGFEDLKANLNEEGQHDAGIITPAGLLVNANRRSVALRDLGKSWIRVALLPGDAGDEEIDALELHLQMRQEFRVKYSFTNELLFVNELITKYRRSIDSVAVGLGLAPSSEPADLRKGREQVEQRIRLLSMVREVQGLSGYRIPLTFFDERRQGLVDLDDVYQNLVQIDPERARKLRDMRLAGLIADIGYEPLREIKEDFLEQYLIPKMERNEFLEDCADILGSPIAAEESLPGVDILTTDGVELDGPDPSRLLSLLAGSANSEDVEINTREGIKKIDRESFIASLRIAMQDAADEARTDRKAEGRLKAPIKHLTEADRFLAKAVDKYRLVAGDPDFDQSRFEDLVQRVRRHSEALNELVVRQQQ